MRADVDIALDEIAVDAGEDGSFNEGLEIARQVEGRVGSGKAGGGDIDRGFLHAIEIDGGLDGALPL